MDLATSVSGTMRYHEIWYSFVCCGKFIALGLIEPRGVIGCRICRRSRWAEQSVYCPYVFAFSMDATG